MCSSYALQLKYLFWSVQHRVKKCCIEVGLKVSTGFSGAETSLYCHGVHSWMPTAHAINNVQGVVRGLLVACDMVIIAMTNRCLFKNQVCIVHDEQ